ncbi:ATP-binding protein [Streptomyces sp. NBC_00554]|uniref:sensor histidine kinase n=1 Tax=unclassified Streptomyces TaxID=2593676 RepID=UPI0022555B44|nr:ATP-binding protein [Streptomyces sp. NBC_00620]MCX4974911.1 ATP-binding protein [Streptomyces sp. NBC_00620]WUC52599.1 ATP-binding protein [Streptomyces sp. NBC_00554]
MLTQGPAQLQLRRKSARLSAVLRAASSVGAAVVAVVGLAPPARPAWVAVAVVGLLVWSGLFTVLMFRPEPRPWLYAGDIAVVLLLCLAHGKLVPAEVLGASAGSGWVDMVASTGVFIAQFVLRQPWAMAAAIAIAVAYAVGAPGVREAPVILVLQGLLAAAVVVLLRHGARRADRALSEEASARASARARSAARSDELEQQRLLHDTVLATLTIVGTGSITRYSAALPERAAADLAVIENLRAHPGAARDVAHDPAPLDVELRTVVLTRRVGLPPLDIEFDVPPLDLPHEVVVALSQGVAEALTNVAQHANTRAARVTARRAGEGVTVEVHDSGSGFDPMTVASHRRGLRESVYGRMRAVGGSARAESSPGAGTRVVLRWEP